MGPLLIHHQHLHALGRRQRDTSVSHTKKRAAKEPPFSKPIAFKKLFADLKVGSGVTSALVFFKVVGNLLTLIEAVKA